LPKSEAYDNIPGNDRVGTYRKAGVAFQPMEQKGIIDYTADPGQYNEGVIYYESTTGRYMELKDGVWADVKKSRLDQILKDKSYIDMPNQASFTFLNPRQIFFGIRVSLDLN